MSTDVLKPVIMVVLLVVAAFVILRPAFGTAPATGPATRRRILCAIALAGLGIGFYDGFIGPGTGTFLVLALTAVLHLDLVTASATAKIVNCCTNAGALAMFAWQGTVLWRLAGLMAVFNLVGGTLGAHGAEEGQRLRAGRAADGGVRAGGEYCVRAVGRLTLR